MIRTCDCGGLYTTEYEAFAGTPCHCAFPVTTEARTEIFNWSDHGASRRSFLRLTGTGAAGFVVGSAIGCGGKSVSGTVVLITGAVSELKAIYPNLPALDKIIKLAESFNADWVAGKFDSARAFFESLDSTVQQVIADLGVNASTRVKLLLASLGIAVRVIASLISEQGTANPAAEMTANAKAPATAKRVNQLANPDVAAQILKAVQRQIE